MPGHVPNNFHQIFHESARFGYKTHPLDHLPNIMRPTMDIKQNLTNNSHATINNGHSSHGHSNSGSKKKRSWSRAVFTNLQRKGLELRFKQQKYITKPERKKLADSLRLTDAQVKVWFQNRRMKDRQTMPKEIDVVVD